MVTTDDLAEIESFKPLLLSYAYHICGVMANAEDIVQDAMIRFSEMDKCTIQNTRAYLIRMVVNQAINEKKRLQKFRDSYPGEWLPEPVSDDAADARLLNSQKLGYAMMILMENLSPKQRAVFILKEGFDYEHQEIAGVLNISVEDSRQLLSRARKNLVDIPEGDRIAPSGFLDQYLVAMQQGNMRALEELLHRDIVLVSDGGGKVVSAINPLHGILTVGAFLKAVSGKYYPNALIRSTTVSGSPALLYFDEGRLVNCQIFIFGEGKTTRMYFIRNPDKLYFLKKSFDLSR